MSRQSAADDTQQQASFRTKTPTATNTCAVKPSDPETINLGSLKR
jgi:hypothetical protein